jgi:hypothetical protein
LCFGEEVGGRSGGGWLGCEEDECHGGSAEEGEGGDAGADGFDGGNEAFANPLGPTQGSQFGREVSAERGEALRGSK